MTKPRTKSPGHSLFLTDKRAREAVALSDQADRRARAADGRSWLALWFALGALVMAGAALSHRILEAMS